MDQEYRIELFDNKRHEVDDFDCGSASLDSYLKDRASQDSRKKVAAIYILRKQTVEKVLAYYTLSSYAMKPTYFPEQIRKKLPKYDVLPAILLGRLAVDRRQQRKGAGEYLLLDALMRTYNLSKQIGSFAVIVDAKNEEARSFCEKYGFIHTLKQPLKLYLPVQTIKTLFN